MQNAGIVTGYTDNSFRPTANITRAEFVTMLARFETPSGVVSHPFMDIMGHWAEEAIADAFRLNWVKGYESGGFRPNAPITRAEAMTMVNRVLDRNVDQQGIIAALVPNWSDISPAHWAYYEVAEAAVSHLYERRNADSPVENWTARGPDAVIAE
jgi:hypothetical protein